VHAVIHHDHCYIQLKLTVLQQTILYGRPGVISKCTTQVGSLILFHSLNVLYVLRLQRDNISTSIALSLVSFVVDLAELLVLS